jgi:hypothetical protein
MSLTEKELAILDRAEASSVRAEQAAMAAYLAAPVKASIDSSAIAAMRKIIRRIETLLASYTSFQWDDEGQKNRSVAAALLFPTPLDNAKTIPAALEAARTKLDLLSRKYDEAIAEAEGDWMLGLTSDDKRAVMGLIE